MPRIAAMRRLDSIYRLRATKNAGRLAPPGPVILPRCDSASTPSQRGKRLGQHIAVIVRNLASGRHPVDDLRKNLRKVRAGIAMRKPQLLRDLADRAGAQDLLQLVTRYRHVL